jgi:ABC-type multidrug transport system fused ATPase/permease subunit
VGFLLTTEVSSLYFYSLSDHQMYICFPLYQIQFLQMGILTMVLFYGGHLVIQGKIDSGLLVSFMLYQFQLGENLRVLPHFLFLLLQSTQLSLQELGEVWNGLMQVNQ